ncbi:MAG: amidohydrolase [Actinomycetota bacterium]|nr:amidohydrolase [Actinomycetota bacterium]
MSAGTDQAYVVISADCHAGADLLGYRDYLDPEYRDDFDSWAASYEIPYEDLKGEEGGRNWDSTRRLRDLESDGIAAEVVFPNTVPPFFRNSSLGSQFAPESRQELDRRWAGLRAHNRWLAEFCASAPGRRAGVIQIALHDIPGSVGAVEWARSAGLTGGVLLPGAPPGSGLPPLHDKEYYEPLWSALEDAAFPVNCHSGGAAPRPSDTPEGHVLFMLELSWWDQRVLRHLLLGGVLERHPNLHFVFTEAGMSWIPRELQTMEYFFDSMKRPRGAADLSFGEQVVSGLSCRPTEYWRRQCHVGASFMHPSEKALWSKIGVDTIMWGSDYPHVEASFPFSREAIALTFGGAAPEAVERILGVNAAALYGFDIGELERVADRIGPRRAEVSVGISPSDIPAAAAKCPAFAGLLSDSGRLRWADNRKSAPAE